MSLNNLLAMLFWLGELIVASLLLSYGAEYFAKKYGAKFVGRTLLSIVTTLPEIAIVIYAAGDGLYGTAIGAGLGSNLLMMTLGLSIMLLIATTRLSRAPQPAIDVSAFRLDKVFLIITAAASAILFIDGYNFIDGFIFAGIFVAYVLLAFREMKAEKQKVKLSQTVSDGTASEIEHATSDNRGGKKILGSTQKAVLAFAAGTLGVFVGAQPFIVSLEGFSVDAGVSLIVLAVIISPIAGEMPEKLSMMILARKGASGASLAIANVLGSKILNNSLLLAVAVFAAMYHGGFYASIGATPILSYQMVLVTAATIIATILMFGKTIGFKVGIVLIAMYAASISIQFVLPHDLNSR